MAFNFNEGKLIAKITDTDLKKYKNKKIFVDDKVDDTIKTFDYLHLGDNEGKFQVVIDPKSDRDAIYVCGSAGSGKSYWACEYIKQYHKSLPKNDIYMISEADNDPLFDKLEYVKRINLEGILDDPLDYKEFSNCLVLFDDIDAMTGQLKKYIYSLRDKLLKNSRKYGVSVISTNHSCTGVDVQAVLNESQKIVFFFNNYNRSMKYLLESYVGLDKNTINILRHKIKSRWCCYCKTYPNVLVCEKDIINLKNIQNF